MGKISLEIINEDNLREVVSLSNTLSDYQKRCVAPNVFSIAEAYVNPLKAWPRAIYLDDQPIGFVMISLDEPDAIKQDQPAYYLWRFMIGGQYQQKGYGKQVLDLIVQKCKEEHIKTLYASCEMIGEQPYQFYIKYGFIDTNEKDDDEEILKLYINN
ncbi:MAG: GNAT family N-acetyltransferase [Bacilli bacterium]